MAQSGTDDAASQLPGPATRTERRVLLSLTFVVAFCSIAYELVYSELLTVFYGGTVVRYSITIGLFMFSLGVGAVLSDHLADPGRNFLRTELYLAVAGPVGAAWIIGLNLVEPAIVAIEAIPLTASPDIQTATLVASHLPIVTVGLLSGFEIPLLTALVPEHEQTLFARLGRLSPQWAIRRVLGVFFTIDEPDGEPFSEVLGVDYLGSLAGTVVYALVLYPQYGLVVTVLLLGLLNGAAALVFVVWRRRSGTSSASSGRFRAVLVAGLLVTGSYASLVAAGNRVDRTVTERYTEAQIQSEYRPGTVSVDVREIETTSYQTATIYDRRITGEGTDTCLRLNRAIQLCDSWVDSYHSGLVDVPMSTFDEPDTVDVLLVGGGDHIATNHLRRYNASVDQVDLDGEFLDYTKDHPFFAQYHDDAYEYDRLNVTVADAVSHLRGSEKRYDLILLDVPGARSDDTLSLYSTEFYRLVRTHLTDRGVAVSWVYSKYLFGTHHKAYVNTVREAGFDQYFAYTATADTDGDGERERGERFYILSDGPTPQPALDRARSPYLANNSGRVRTTGWRALPTYRGVEPNSVFDPNYDIIIE